MSEPPFPGQPGAPVPDDSESTIMIPKPGGRRAAAPAPMAGQAMTLDASAVLSDVEDTAGPVGLNPLVANVTLNNVMVNGISLGTIQVVHGSGGITQFADANGGVQVNLLQQNGFPAGSLQQVSINDKGRVVGSYSNGRTLQASVKAAPAAGKTSSAASSTGWRSNTVNASKATALIG